MKQNIEICRQCPQYEIRTQMEIPWKSRNGFCRNLANEIIFETLIENQNRIFSTDDVPKECVMEMEYIVLESQKQKPKLQKVCSAVKQFVFDVLHSKKA